MLSIHQRVIGADIMMAFDECTPYPCHYNYARDSMQLTHRWLDRCIDRYRNTHPLYGHAQELYPIVQGSTYHDLRKESAEFIASKEAGGNAIGGLAVGEPHEVMYEISELVCDILPKGRAAIPDGRGHSGKYPGEYRRGHRPVRLRDAYTLTDATACCSASEGIISIRDEKWEKDFSPVDPNGACSFVGSTNIHEPIPGRLFLWLKEYLGGMISSLHNVAFCLSAE
ncbi:MAG: tRNA-guanine transglycosylase [Bacteroidales bacterium]|nr:tRNA-guanine transglycosylase [Bacteroidales bacterium]